MDAFLQDFAFSVRTLVRRPAFTLLTIALGIGANTAIFTVVHAVLLRPLPFPEPDRLVMVWEQDRTRGWERVPGSAEDYLSWRNEVASLSALGGVAGSSFALTRDGEPQRVSGARVTADFWDVFRVPPLAGVPFGPDANVDGAHRRVVLSHDLWDRRYGADPGIVGRTIEVDGEGFEVAAVLPRAFRFPAPPRCGSPSSSPRRSSRTATGTSS
ncbi:MAG TPA: ABC transporter permease [Longimicrobiales bacterium]|nr:ABC transporter permease [Longimicrobiales bacterium]